MISDNSLYNDCNEFINFVYMSASDDRTKIRHIYQLVFSCLPLFTGCKDISVDLYDNLFLKYWRKAPFVQWGCKFTELYRVYSSDMFCNEHQNFELLNYMLLKYNAAPDLNVQSYDCFSLFLVSRQIVQ